MTLAGIESPTFRFVAQHLNHCATAVPKIAIGCPETSVRNYHCTLLNCPAERSSVLKKKIISSAVCMKRCDTEYSAEDTITLVLVSEGHECVEIHVSLLAAYSSDYQGLDVIVLNGNLFLMKHAFKRQLPRSHW
jgi:hypothetical protein